MPILTLAALKAHLEIEGIARDTRLTALVDGVDAFIVERTGRTWAVAASVTEDRRGTGTPAILLKHYPVTALTSVAIDGDALTVGAYDTEGDVSLDAQHGILFRLDGAVWPASLRPNVRIIYSGGMEPPADLVLAALEIAAYVYRVSGGLQSTNTLGFAQSHLEAALGDLPTVREILALRADSARGFLS